MQSCVRLFGTPWTAACQAPLTSTVSPSLFKFMSTESVMLSHHFILRCPLLLLPSIFPNIRVFSNELALCIRWPKFWSFGLSISPSNEYLGLISSRMDWFDLLTVQGPPKSSQAPQFGNVSSSVLSLLCGPALTSVHDWWENHSLNYTEHCWQSDVSVFNMLSRFDKALLPRSIAAASSYLRINSKCTRDLWRKMKPYK